ncbi:hypothetical protein RHSIM_Rhsim09G0113500 [Rhododendron simsii]|uniref:TauD/TfdA-like domain-containing protein n=1 Tax=Rhododendron simsii TaxID=118357 RepID=A0A834GGV5_RHOSS|nr:hypothetical protein RHSIM_Rhsim09G0113500 [Rhododendron simsii]
MPTTLISVFLPLPSRYATPTPALGALETKTILKNSRSLHPISPMYHSISLPVSLRGPLPLFSALVPNFTIEGESTEMEVTCEDFKVGKCKGQKLVDGVTMPLVLQPPEEPKNNNDMQSLLLALEKNNDWFKQMIIKNGAVLLRGFNVRNAEDFNDVVQTFRWDHVPYVGPALRTSVFKQIWTANEGPLSETIAFHHEMVLMKPYPEYVMFFCEVPPPEGGETPIGPSCRVAKRMMEEFPEAVKEMEEKGLKYTFRAPPQTTTSTFTGRSWPEFLGSPDPAEAVKKAKANADIDVEWLPDGSAHLTLAPRPLTMVFEGRKGRKVWFNLIHLMYNKELASVTMMDGTEIPEKIVRRIEEIIEEESIQFRWEKGDILFLDNLAVYHGRRPSLPPRKVLVATCKVASV